MKYRRRRRKNSRRKSSEVIVLSDTEESKNEAKETTKGNGTNTEITMELNQQEIKEMEAPKEDPIHAPDDEEESPVVVTQAVPDDVLNRDPDCDHPAEPSRVPECYDTEEGSNDLKNDTRNGKDITIPSSIEIDQSKEMSEVQQDNVNETMVEVKETNDNNEPVNENTKSHIGLNSRETTFQKLRERIMMNKLQKSNSSENTNPIRPSLYRKYPKRKANRDRSISLEQSTQYKEVKISEAVHHEQFKVVPVEVPQRAPETEDYQRYYLQPINPYGTVAMQVPIKQEPSEDIKPTPEIANDMGITERERRRDKCATRDDAFIKQDISSMNIGSGGAKRNLEPEFDESCKKPTDEERIWLRALKEEGMKEVKRNENIAGISQQYQNEYYKFIEGKDFSKEAKEVYNFNSQLEKKMKSVEKNSDETGQSVDMQTTAKEAFELTDFCSSLMARHPLYLQPCEEQGTNGAPGGQVVFVPKLVPYPPNASQVNVQGQGQCRCQGQKCQGQCQHVMFNPGTQVYNPNIQSVLPTRVGQTTSHLTSGNTIHPPGLFEHLNQVPQVLDPRNGSNTIEAVTDENHAIQEANEDNNDVHQQSNASSHNSRRKQNAPKRRKPKDGADESTECAKSDGSHQPEENSTQSHISQQMVPNATPIAIPEIPTPNKDVAYAYIAIPVSAFVPNSQTPKDSTTPTLTPQPYTFPQPIDFNKIPPSPMQGDQNQVQSQALDFSATARSNREQGEGILGKGQGHITGQKPVQPVHPLPVQSIPVNPFTQNVRHGQSSQPPSQVQDQGHQRLPGRYRNIHGHANYSQSSLHQEPNRNRHRAPSAMPQRPSQGHGQTQGHAQLRQHQLQSASLERVPQPCMSSASLPPKKKIKYYHPAQSTTQFSHFACLQRNSSHSKQQQDVLSRSQGHLEQAHLPIRQVFNPVARQHQMAGNHGITQERLHEQQAPATQHFNKTLNPHSENPHGVPVFLPMQVPVRSEPSVQSRTHVNIENTHGQIPRTFGHAQGHSAAVFQNQDTRRRKQSHFIDLTDDADDVEDVYSPGDDDVTLHDNTAKKQQHNNNGNIVQSQQEENLPNDDAQAIQEEQIRLMDNVSKLAELHSEVGALLNESTHILDTLAPAGANEADEHEAKKSKRKKGKTGRKLIKYDAKGRRIFKFHEYCPR